MKLRLALWRLGIFILKWLKDLTTAILISVVILDFGCAFFIVGWHFSDVQNITTHLTNYGFAIFAALASISFSWYRAIEKNMDGYNSRIKKLILGCAECSFAGAVIFLTASVLKYTSLYFSSFHQPTDAIIAKSLIVVFVFLFPFAFVLIIMILRFLFYRSIYISRKEKKTESRSGVD